MECDIIFAESWFNGVSRWDCDSIGTGKCCNNINCGDCDDNVNSYDEAVRLILWAWAVINDTSNTGGCYDWMWQLFLVNQDDDSALHTATTTSRFEMVKYFVRRGLDVNTFKEYGWLQITFLYIEKNDNYAFYETSNHTSRYYFV